MSSLLRAWFTVVFVGAVLSACVGSDPHRDGGDGAATLTDMGVVQDGSAGFDAPDLSLDANSICRPNLLSIQQNLLIPRCTNGRCHGAVRPVAALDLASANLELRLINVVSGDCPMQTLIVPGRPELSYFLRKLRDANPTCGARMPTGTNPLSNDDLQCISQWIDSLRSDDGGASPDGTDATPLDSRTCAMGQQICGANCVDTQTDRGHCGGCNTACPAGNVCVGGSCRCPGAQLNCGANCVDPQSNVSHCGACNRACIAGQTCTNGACVCMGQLRACAGACVDVLSDRMHCGGCDAACSIGLVCTAGRCFRVCAMGETECNGACINLATSLEHCGACGNRCGAGLTCAAGRCECPGGTTLCGGSCVDVGTNPSHCGACNNACGAGRMCTAGRCACVAPTIECAGSCVDPQSSTTHCGMCNNQCAFGGSCQAGVCACPAGQSACAGTCLDLQSSQFNCGACGNVCNFPQFCGAGRCQCPVGQTLCQGQCVSTPFDDNHCGRCGNTCPPGQMCVAGVCNACGGMPVSFAMTVGPMLNAGCTAGCHGGAFPSAGLDLSLGNARAALLGQSSNVCAPRRFVSPAAITSSYLVNKLTGAGMCGGSRMPLFGAPFNDGEIEFVRRWICQGASDN